MLLTPAPAATRKAPPRPGFTSDSLLAFMAEIARDSTGGEISKKFGYLFETALYQAIVDDDRDLVKKILDKNPGLLLVLHQDDMLIQSQYTWQTFKIGPDESPLAVAAKRRQIEMVKLLLPYYDKLAQNGFDEECRQRARFAKEAGLSAWPSHDTAKNEEGENEIVIPAGYARRINSLIDTFKNETLKAKQTDFTDLSNDTENEIRLLLDMLAPESGMKLDNHIDVELLLLTAYQLFNNRFSDFVNSQQRHAFCIRVIGLIQSALSPETAKVFCEGLFYVVERGRLVGVRAASLKLHGDQSFYRTERDSLSGLGGKYFCSEEGWLSEVVNRESRRAVPVLLQALYQTKASELERLRNTHNSNQQIARAERARH